MLALVTPAEQYLASYTAALELGGWSPHSRDETRVEHLGQIATNARAFLDSLDDREAKGSPLRLRDGSLVPRLPSFERWMWDGDFAGTIRLRWQPGTEALPPWYHGHIGYAVVPWKRRRGYATAALRMLLPEARREGLRYVELTTEPDNVASQRVILANGGLCVGRFRRRDVHGGAELLRYRIVLT